MSYVVERDLAFDTGPRSATTQRVVGANAQNVELLASAARVAGSANGAAVASLGGYRGAEIQLDVTAAATDVDDTLDVYVQTTIDGVNWIDIVHFLQVLGTGGAKRFVCKVVAGEPQGVVDVSSALVEGDVRHILGDQLRARWDIVDPAGANASFTFGLKANFLP